MGGPQALAHAASGADLQQRFAANGGAVYPTEKL